MELIYNIKTRKPGKTFALSTPKLKKNIKKIKKAKKKGGKKEQRLTKWVWGGQKTKTRQVFVNEGLF